MSAEQLFAFYARKREQLESEGSVDGNLDFDDILNNMGVADLMKGFSDEEERKVDTDKESASQIQAQLLKAFDEHRTKIKENDEPVFVKLTPDGVPSESDSDAPPSANFSEDNEEPKPVPKETPEQKKQRMMNAVEDSIRRASSASEDESKKRPARGMTRAQYYKGVKVASGTEDNESNQSDSDDEDDWLAQQRANFRKKSATSQ